MVVTLRFRHGRRMTIALTRAGLRTATWCKGDVPLWRDGGDPGAGVREPRRPPPSGSSGAATLTP